MHLFGLEMYNFPNPVQGSFDKVLLVQNLKLLSFSLGIFRRSEGLQGYGEIG